MFLVRRSNTGTTAAGPYAVHLTAEELAGALQGTFSCGAPDRRPTWRKPPAADARSAPPGMASPRCAAASPWVQFYLFCTMSEYWPCGPWLFDREALCQAIWQVLSTWLTHATCHVERTNPCGLWWFLPLSICTCLLVHHHRAGYLQCCWICWSTRPSCHGAQPEPMHGDSVVRWAAGFRCLPGMSPCRHTVSRGLNVGPCACPAQQ